MCASAGCRVIDQAAASFSSDVLQAWFIAPVSCSGFLLRLPSKIFTANPILSMCIFALPLLTESSGLTPWHHSLLPYLQEPSFVCQNPDLFTCYEGGFYPKPLPPLPLLRPHGGWAPGFRVLRTWPSICESWPRSPSTLLGQLHQRSVVKKNAIMFCQEN